MTEARYTLYYFTGGGRASPIRDAFAMGRVAFEDVRLGFPEFVQRRAAGEFPFRALPVLDVERDGAVERVSQCNGILRFVGRLTDLYPGDPLAALRVDEVLEALEEITTHITLTVPSPRAQKLVARRSIHERVIARILDGFERRRQGATGEFFVGDRYTVADLKAFHDLDTLASGRLEGLTAEVLAPYPALREWLVSARAARAARLGG